jgi:hypothetical protein
VSTPTVHRPAAWAFIIGAAGTTIAGRVSASRLTLQIRESVLSEQVVLASGLHGRATAGDRELAVDRAALRLHGVR